MHGTLDSSKAHAQVLLSARACRKPAPSAIVPTATLWRLHRQHNALCGAAHMSWPHSSHNPPISCLETLQYP